MRYLAMNPKKKFMMRSETKPWIRVNRRQATQAINSRRRQTKTITVILQIIKTFMISILSFNSVGVIRQTLIKVEKHMNRTSLEHDRNNNSVIAKQKRNRAQRSSSKESGTMLKENKIKISREISRRSKNNMKMNTSRKEGEKKKNIEKTRRLIMNGLNKKKKRIITLRISAEKDIRLSQMQKKEQSVKRCTKNGTLIRKVNFIIASEVFLSGRWITVTGLLLLAFGSTLKLDRPKSLWATTTRFTKILSKLISRRTSATRRCNGQSYRTKTHTKW